MAKLSKALKIAFDHAARLPKFRDERSARKGFFAAIAARRDRLRKLIAAGGGPTLEISPDGLRALELWESSLSPEAHERLGCNSAELNHLLHWHMASVAVQCVPYTRWVVELSPFARDHWQVGVRCGLMTVWLAMEAGAPEPTRRRHASATPHFDQLRWFEERVSRDPTLHPAVIACKSRLSKEDSLRLCQTFTLIRGIDAFNQTALVAALPNSEGIKRLEVIRCFESLRSLSEPAIRALCKAARSKGGWPEFAIGLVIRHRPTTGLRLATELRAELSEYRYGPVVEAIVSIQDLAATDILADAVCKISARKHSLWQSGETFAKALGRLRRSARNGDAKAQAALVIAGRRWKRIAPETLALVRKHAPGLTMDTAKAGGIAM